MPSHHFRIRFRLPDGIVLKSDKASLRLPTSTGGSEYVLDAVGAKTLNESQWLLIKDAGDGFATEGEAREAGRQAKNAVMWWGAKARAGVDVGDDTSKAVVTQAYIDLYREEQGVRLLNELHGLQVYEEDPELPTQFVAASVEPKVLKSTEDFARHFREAVDRRLEIDEKATLAFELYGLSHFEAAERARLLTLISAIEAASEAKPRGGSPRGEDDRAHPRLRVVQRRDSLDGWQPGVAQARVDLEDVQGLRRDVPRRRAIWRQARQEVLPGLLRGP